METIPFIGYADLTVVNFEKLGITDPIKQKIYLEGIRGGAGLFDLFEQKVLDHIFTDPAWSPPATLYLALSSTTPAEGATNVTEPSTGAYARVATTAADWGAASGTAPAVKSNTATFTYPAATADWLAQANLTYFVLMASLAGVTTADYIAFGAMTTPKPVLNGDTASFAAAAITFQMGDPGDTY